MNRMFWGGITVNVFAVLLLRFLEPRPLYAFVGFQGIMLWSWVVIVYAFQSLLRAANRSKELFRRQSFVDQITGVFNYRYLELRLGEEEERTRRYGGFTALLYIDLDNFKPVNDRFGHQVGDIVLEGIASTMADKVRTCDVLGRMGGDEFLAVLPQTDRRQARTLAERLRAAVARYELDLGGDRRIDFVRASIGIAAFPLNGQNMRDVIAAADAGVYEAKRQGGDTVCIAEEFVGTQDAEESIVEDVRGPEEERERGKPGAAR